MLFCRLMPVEVPDRCVEVAKGRTVGQEIHFLHDCTYNNKGGGGEKAVQIHRLSSGMIIGKCSLTCK